MVFVSNPKALQDSRVSKDLSLVISPIYQEVIYIWGIYTSWFTVTADVSIVVSAGDIFTGYLPNALVLSTTRKTKP